MRHRNASGEPCKEVVVHRATLLKLCDPQITAGNAQAGTVAAKLFGCRAHVVSLPIIDTNVSESYKPSSGWTVAFVGHGVKVAHRPHVPTELFDPFPRPLNLIKADG